MILDVSINGTPPLLGVIKSIEEELKDDLLIFKSQFKILKNIHSIWRKMFVVALMALVFIKFGPSIISNNSIPEGIVVVILMLYFSGAFIDWLIERPNGARSKVEKTEKNIESIQPLCPVKNVNEILLLGEAVLKIRSVETYVSHLKRAPTMFEFLIIKKLIDKVKKEEGDFENILAMPEKIQKSLKIFNSIQQKNMAGEQSAKEVSNES